MPSLLITVFPETWALFTVPKDCWLRVNPRPMGLRDIYSTSRKQHLQNSLLCNWRANSRYTRLICKPYQLFRLVCEDCLHVEQSSKHDCYLRQNLQRHKSIQTTWELPLWCMATMTLALSTQMQCIDQCYCFNCFVFNAFTNQPLSSQIYIGTYSTPFK